MPVDIDSGNPNVFTLYKGKYEMDFVEGVSSSDDPTVMLTANDIVCLLRDIELQTYTAGSRIATMPDACRPAADVILPVAVSVGENRTVELLTVEDDGMMSLAKDVQGAIVEVAGLTYNIGAKFYSKENDYE